MNSLFKPTYNRVEYNAQQRAMIANLALPKEN